MEIGKTYELITSIKSSLKICENIWIPTWSVKGELKHQDTISQFSGWQKLMTSHLVQRVKGNGNSYALAMEIRIGLTLSGRN